MSSKRLFSSAASSKGESPFVKSSSSSKFSFWLTVRRLFTSKSASIECSSMHWIQYECPQSGKSNGTLVFSVNYSLQNGHWISSKSASIWFLRVYVVLRLICAFTQLLINYNYNFVCLTLRQTDRFQQPELIENQSVFVHNNQID